MATPGAALISFRLGGSDGVSVEAVDEAMRALKHPNVQSVQIIFNMFRLKPAE